MNCEKNLIFIFVYKCTLHNIFCIFFSDYFLDYLSWFVSMQNRKVRCLYWGFKLRATTIRKWLWCQTYWGYYWHCYHTMFAGNKIISVCVEYWNVMFECHFPRGPYYMPVNSSKGYYLSRLSFWKQCQHLFSHVRSCFDAFSCLDFSLSLQKKEYFP